MKTSYLILAAAAMLTGGWLAGAGLAKLRPAIGPCVYMSHQASTMMSEHDCDIRKAEWARADYAAWAQQQQAYAAWAQQRQQLYAQQQQAWTLQELASAQRQQALEQQQLASEQQQLASAQRQQAWAQQQQADHMRMRALLNGHDPNDYSYR